MKKCLYCEGDLVSLPPAYPCFHNRYKCIKCGSFFIPSLGIYNKKEGSE
jgi:transposase-like protein